ncbi:REL2 [Trypanosoma cruzi Dm28c]|uniref:RNA ligase (ATP) n=1 Tax=Trypanosoma cruzi Dm28c TaxID=1416333 RepID=V5ASZ3_TRYCR|nr:REL2 [Trypanosoma cruzi Dm28c]PBJ78031.1 RNA editing ligase,RNA editing complex protein [Trypanosoma cruzi cruzi]
MLRRHCQLFLRKTPLWLADDGSSLFERYTEIENSNERRMSALKACGMFDDEWIATEKVHGANFGIYSIEGEKTIRYAKRSGIMPPTEHFFGYHMLVPQLQQYITVTREMLCDKLQKKLHTVLINGELFGGKYDHPSLQKTRKTVMVAGKPRTITAVQTDSFPQYSPDLHFYAFDIKYKETNEAEYVTLTFDEATELFKRVPGLLYARAIIRGPMSKVAAFDVEHFVTTIPPLVGMGNYPLKGNWAEGLVVKHAKRGTPGFDPKGLTILKFKCTAFQEISTDRRQGPRVDEMEGVRRDSISRSGIQLPALESIIHDPAQLEASKFLLDHICENRLNAVLSKIGTDPFEKQEMTPDDLATLLAKDALKDFLKEAEPAIVNTPILTRRDMARYVLFESRQLVCSRWKAILQRQTADVVE